MSTSLEDRLSDHLRGHADTGMAEPAAIATVQQIAKRRSMRTRAAVGVASLAAIAGLASFIPTGTEPSALVTAEQPAEETPGATQEAAQETAEEEAPAEELSTRVGEAATAPASWRVIADGTGGFAAIGVKTSTGMTSFVRSDDGQRWYHAGEWKPEDDLVITELRQVDGAFLAILDIDRPAGTLPTGLRDPHIARSDDLNEWTMIDLDLEPAHETSRFTVSDAAVRGDEVMVAFAEYQVPTDDFASSQEQNLICSASTTTTTVTIGLCSGEISVNELTEPSLYHAPAVRLLVSTAGEPAIELPVPSSSGPSERIEVFGSRSGLYFSYLDGPRADPLLRDGLVDAGVDPDAVEILSVTNNQRGQVMVLTQSASGLATVLLPDGIVAELPHDEHLDAGVASHVVSGPAGWVIALGPQPARSTSLLNDGWRVSGAPAAGFVNLVAEDGSERHQFIKRGGATSWNPQWSVFGGVRYYRPGTDELIVELTAVEALWPYALENLFDSHVVDPEEFVATATVDGWALSGNPLRGPLVLTSPDGETRTFDDGFAFTNGDWTDGVEMEPHTLSLSPFVLLAPHTPIQFFDADGQVEVSFHNGDLHPTMVAPLVVREPEDLSEEDFFGPPDLHILYSSDGVSWRVVDELPILNEFGQPEIAIGIDEILVRRHDWAIVERIDLSGLDDLGDN